MYLTMCPRPVYLLCCPVCQLKQHADDSKQTKTMLHLLQLDMGNFRSATRTASCLIKLARFDEAVVILQQFQAALPAGSRPPREWQTKMQELSDAKRLLEEVSCSRLTVHNTEVQACRMQTLSKACGCTPSCKSQEMPKSL